MNKKLIFFNNISLHLKRFYRLVFLDKNQKDFIKHNYVFFKDTKTLVDSTKIILMELNTTVNNIISYSYFASSLSKKYNAKLIGFTPRIPRTRYNRIIWRLRGLIGSSFQKIYKSFGVEDFLIPSENSFILNETDRIYKEQLLNINSKSDVENIKIYDVIYGDLIYDDFLNYYKLPTIDIHSKIFERHLFYSIKLIVFWHSYFKNNDVEAINVSHTAYTNAIPLRAGAKNGVNCFQCNESHVYRVTKEQIFAYKDFVNYAKIFSTLDSKDKKLGIDKAKERIEKRLSGEVGVDMAYSTKSAFLKPSKNRLLSNSKKIKILLAPHCFFDSPHPFGLNLFPDVMEWLEALVSISNDTDYEWYVKTHPDFIYETRRLVLEFFKPHPQFKILPAEASHLQLVEEGIDFALTMYGTIGFEYAVMNVPVINASINNPHIAYDFNIHPQSKEDYVNLLMNLHDVEHKINVNKVYEYYFMHHLFFSKNWLFENFNQMVEDSSNYHNKKLDLQMYTYWIDKLTQKRHEEILKTLDEFLDSDQYRLITK